MPIEELAGHDVMNRRIGRMTSKNHESKNRENHDVTWRFTDGSDGSSLEPSDFRYFTGTGSGLPIQKLRHGSDGSSLEPGDFRNFTRTGSGLPVQTFESLA
ncbi:hypothetical protein AMTR_s00088p00105180 [Amborella trichopoda]|uniref:Uncharacterized protein n=1 Tax=Amborella trichopoda TaxID=13333 RepID=W1NWA1_AMBTC|nr:hypothetical protein AMTR_s00088p00105180 [Amborella trichopoda]